MMVERSKNNTLLFEKYFFFYLIGRKKSPAFLFNKQKNGSRLKQDYLHFLEPPLLTFAAFLALRFLLSIQIYVELQLIQQISSTAGRFFLNQ